MAFFEYDFNIRLRDVGFNNELSNQAILGFFEDIGGLHSDSVGYGLNKIYETRLSWVLLHWKIEVFKRAKYGDKIHIKTWSRYSQKFYSYRDFEMYDDNGNLLVIGTSKWTLINIDKGLERISDEHIAKYQPEDKSVFNIIELPKLKEPEISNSATFEYTVSRTDIDINKHMHNLYYLDIAYEALPDNVYENSNFTNVEIMYKTGALLGESLKCFYCFIDKEHYVIIKSFDERNLHCIIKLS